MSKLLKNAVARPFFHARAIYHATPVNQKPVFTATDVKIKMYSPKLVWPRVPSNNSPVQSLYQV